MADVAKYVPINGGTLLTDLKTHFSLFRTKRTLTCAYVFVFVFIAFTIFIAFSPSSNSASPWFSNIFTTNFTTTIPATSIFPNGSHFSPVFSYFFPNSSAQLHNSTLQPLPPSIARSENTTSQLLGFTKNHSNVKNQTQNTDTNSKVANFKPNQTQDGELKSKGEILKANQSSIVVSQSQLTTNQTVNSSPKPSSEVENATRSDQKNTSEKGVAKNLTSSLNKKQSNEGTNSAVSVKQGIGDLVKSLENCNLYDGNWVKDDSYPLYEPNSCSLIDEQFNCFRNGRPDHDYYKLKWKPRGCSIPRLNGTHMLELLRGKRLAYVGDSLNRNMWESLVCILRNSVKDQNKVYEINGRMHFRGEASYAFIFEDYDLRVEFYVSPFLVQEWEVTDKSGAKKERLRLDLVGHTSEKYKNADFIIFNTGHWWTHEKTSLGKDYYQEGSHVYSELNVLEAFRKALTTWARFVDANVNPTKTHVMFRGYSASHFSGGQWNSGGQCDHETQPIKNETYLTAYPPMMTVMEKVLKNMKVHVSYLNITRLSDYRKDGHPSMYRKQHLSEQEKKSPLRFQDCSHWCLPGVPDAWNELLYAELLVKIIRKKQ